MNNPCPICGEVHYSWVSLQTNNVGDFQFQRALVAVLPQRRETGEKGPFGGDVKRQKRRVEARMCENCGNLQLFATEWI